MIPVASGKHPKRGQLTNLRDARIEPDGGILFPYVRFSNFFTASLGTVVEAHACPCGTHVAVYINGNTAGIQVRGTDGSINSATITNGVSAATSASVVRWGAFLYIVFDSGTSALKYDLNAHTVAAVAGIPANASQLFLLDNNLIAVSEDASGAVNIQWSVDSSPEDFTSIGSGSSLRYELVAPYLGAVDVEGTAIVAARGGAVRMIPTGVAEPAFAFRQEPAIKGGIFKGPHGITAKDGTIFYADQNGYITVYQGNQTKKIYFINSVTSTIGGLIYYSRSLDLVLFTEGSRLGLTAIDPNTLKVVGQVGESNDVEFVADSQDNAFFNVLLYDNTNQFAEKIFELDTITGLNQTPSLDTGYVDFGADVLVESINFDWALDPGTTYDSLVVEIDAIYENGSTGTLTFDLSQVDNIASTWVLRMNQAARAIRVRFNSPLVALPTELTGTGVLWNRLHGIYAVGELQESAEGNVLR